MVSYQRETATRFCNTNVYAKRKPLSYRQDLNIERAGQGRFMQHYDHRRPGRLPQTEQFHAMSIIKNIHTIASALDLNSSRIATHAAQLSEADNTVPACRGNSSLPTCSASSFLIFLGFLFFGTATRPELEARARLPSARADCERVRSGTDPAPSPRPPTDPGVSDAWTDRVALPPQVLLPRAFAVLLPFLAVAVVPNAVWRPLLSM